METGLFGRIWQGAMALEGKEGNQEKAVGARWLVQNKHFPLITRRKAGEATLASAHRIARAPLVLSERRHNERIRRLRGATFVSSRNTYLSPFPFPRRIPGSLRGEKKNKKRAERIENPTRVFIAEQKKGDRRSLLTASKDHEQPRKPADGEREDSRGSSTHSVSLCLYVWWGRWEKSQPTNALRPSSFLQTR